MAVAWLSSRAGNLPDFDPRKESTELLKRDGVAGLSSKAFQIYEMLRERFEFKSVLAPITTNKYLYTSQLGFQTFLI